MGNQLPTFSRLEVPSFDLLWAELNGKSVILVPGGGGNFKSGVSNQIQIFRFATDGKGKLEPLKSFNTDHGGKAYLCSGVAAGVSAGVKIVVAVVGASCTVLKLMKEQSSASEGVNLVRVADFKADFSDDGTINCASVIPSGHIATGGDDGLVRLWSLKLSQDGKGHVENIFEMKGHAGPVMALSFHPTDALIGSASKDGTCKIWNVVNGKIVCDIPFLVGNATSKPSTAVPKMECRGCSFSINGESFYTIQSGRRGPTDLIEWSLQNVEDVLENSCKGAKNTNSATTVNNETAEKDSAHTSVVNDSTRAIIRAEPVRVMAVAKVPCTRLAVSESGSHIAVGASDGSVIVVDEASFAKISSSACHDLPVTGLGFAPQHIAAEAGSQEIVVSCSADYKMATVRISGDISFATKVVVIIISVAVIILLVLLSIILLQINVSTVTSQDKEL